MAEAEHVTEHEEWMTAGRFGAETLLSAKALRIYAERGLLQPRRIDESTGYRYYSADQVPTGWLIALLRSADLSLEQIAAILDRAEADPAGAVALLDAAVASMHRRVQANDVVLARARLHLTKETPMSAVETTIEADRAWFLESGYFEAPKARAIRAEVNALCGEVAEHAVALVDAFGIPDSVLRAPAGRAG